MRFFLLLSFVFTLASFKAQNIPIYWTGGWGLIDKDDKSYSLIPKVYWTDSLIQNKSIIYGRYFRRRGGGTSQTEHSIRIQNVKTGQKYTFIIKRRNQIKKSNVFICHIPPGTYQIINYKYTQENVIVTTIVENVYNDLDIRQPGLRSKIKKGEINLKDYHRFEFTIKPNTINFMGEWNFEKGIPTFSDNKKNINTVMEKYYRMLSFSNVITNLPK